MVSFKTNGITRFLTEINKQILGTYRDYTELEEKLNYSTHLFALAFYMVACPYLIYRATLQLEKVNITGLVIFSIGLIAVYSTSSLYHYVKDRGLKTQLRTMDHMAIYLLIGGTYTPVINKYIENPLGTVFLTILWLILIGGIVMKFFFMGRFKTFSIGLYVFLGCMVLFLIKPIVNAMPHDIFILVLIGGLMYLVGVLFYVNKKHEYSHTVWHIFVMAASFCHYLAIFNTSVNP
jgi:hemolysin III